MKLTHNTIDYNVNTIEELEGLAGEENQVVVVTEENRGGTFVYRSADVATNNGGTIFNGWTRQYSGAVNVKWFADIQEAFNIGGVIEIDTNIYRTEPIYLVSNSVVRGRGTITNTTTETFNISEQENISIIGISLIGYVGGYSIVCTGSSNIKILNNNVAHCALISLDSTASTYALADTGTRNYDITIDGNVCNTDINHTSGQAIRMFYTHDFSITNNKLHGYYDGILVWGGNSDVAIDGAYGSDRKSSDGIIANNIIDIYSAGIWCSMAERLSVTGNNITGQGIAEGIDAEGSIDIEFINNIVYNFNIGMGLFFLNDNILYKGNVITCPNGALGVYNNVSGYSDDYTNYGTVSFVENKIKPLNHENDLIVLSLGGTGRINIIENNFVNCSIGFFESGDVMVDGNEFLFYKEPLAAEALRTGTINSYFNKLSSSLVSVFSNNIIQWVGVGLYTKQGLLLSIDNISSYDIVVTGNSFLGGFNIVTYDNATLPYNVTVSRNICNKSNNRMFINTSETPSGNMQVTFTENVTPDGLDFYGSIISANHYQSYYGVGSRIKNNAPAPGEASEWVCTTATTTSDAVWDTAGDIEDSGTWTPILVDASYADEGATYAANDGTYEVKGNIVFFHCRLDITGIGTLTGTSNAYIIGLPRVSASAPVYPVVSVGFLGGTGFSSGLTLEGFISPSTNRISLRKTIDGSTTGSAGFTINELTNSGASNAGLSLSGYYFI